MSEDDTEEVEFGMENLNTTPFGQLLQLQIRMNMLEDKLDLLERSLNLIKIGGTFILLIVSCDYLNDMGWFGGSIANSSVTQFGLPLRQTLEVYNVQRPPF